MECNRGSLSERRLAMLNQHKGHSSVVSIVMATCYGVIPNILLLRNNRKHGSTGRCRLCSLLRFPSKKDKKRKDRPTVLPSRIGKRKGIVRQEERPVVCVCLHSEARKEATVSEISPRKCGDEFEVFSPSFFFFSKLSRLRN